MRCNICDRVLDEPKYNEELATYEPCDTCMAVILDTIGSFTDKPYAAEDELPGEWAIYFTAQIPPEEE